MLASERKRGVPQHFYAFLRRSWQPLGLDRGSDGHPVRLARLVQGFMKERDVADRRMYEVEQIEQDRVSRLTVSQTVSEGNFFTCHLALPFRL